MEVTKNENTNDTLVSMFHSKNSLPFVNDDDDHSKLNNNDFLQPPRKQLTSLSNPISIKGFTGQSHSGKISYKNYIK